jgi:hypothetical protein
MKVENKFHFSKYDTQNKYKINYDGENVCPKVGTILKLLNIYISE